MQSQRETQELSSEAGAGGQTLTVGAVKFVCADSSCGAAENVLDQGRRGSWFLQAMPRGQEQRIDYDRARAL